MITPLEIRSDHEANAYEIRYGLLPKGTFIDHDERVGPGVTVSFAPDGRVIGLELIGLSATTVAAARDYADGHDLEFPHDFPGLVRARRRLHAARA